MRFLTHMAHNVPAPRCTGTEQDESDDIELAAVAGDVNILISEIGLDVNERAQYGSLLGQLTHRQQKLRVIAQGDQVRAGAATVYCVHTDP